MHSFFGLWILSLIPAMVWAASLSDISSMFSFPLQWKTYTLTYKTASNCIANVGGNTWVLGGKAFGVNNDISNTVRKEKFNSTSFTTLIKDQTLLNPGSFPGQYIISPGMYCTLGAQVSYGTYNSVQKMCYLGANDGTSNSPQCGCCVVEESGSTSKCEDLDNLLMCPPVFASCVVNDLARNRGIQIGGSTGTASVKNILCFDMTTQKYTYSPGLHTVSLLQSEETTFDPRCEYGSLTTSAFDVGCDLLPDSTRPIIVVGGRAISGTSFSFLDTVQICKPNYQDCQLQSLRLPQPTSQVRVLGLTSCIFAAFGGLTSNGRSSQLHIGDICDQKWLYTETLPATLSEFSLVIGSNVLCLYGGIMNNMLQNTAYCTRFNPPLLLTTPKPTTKPTNRPTFKPTLKPTQVPTPPPTVAGQGTPQFYQGWKTTYQWSDGFNSQSCYANKDFLFILGGKNNAKQSLNTLTAFDSSNRKTDYTLYQYNPLLPSQSMIPFYCPNGCSGGYQNRVYLVNPYTDDGLTSARLYECTINSNTKSATCRDLCDSQYGILPYCASVLFWDACVTAQDQYLYIIGGRDSLSQRNSITVFDMAKRDWASVPQGTPAASKYPTLYGTLAVSVINHACAAWDYNLYIFGGQTSGNAATNTIQFCEKEGACYTQGAKLSIARYYSSAVTIGSTIVVLCGSMDSQTVTDVVELYDINKDKIRVNYNGANIGLILPSARRSCCVSRWDSASTLMLSGGMSSPSTSQSVKTVSAAAYGIQENFDDGTVLSSCNNIILRSSNVNFFGGFFFYADIRQYRVWVSNSFDSVIYYQPENYDHTWIGNLSSQVWSYYPGTGFTTDYWKILSTKTTPEQTVYFEFMCLDNEMYASEGSDSDTIAGLPKGIFITVVVLSVVIALMLIGFGAWFCVKRYKNREKPITIQSSSYGGMKKILSKSSTVIVAQKAEDSREISKEDSNANLFQKSMGSLANNDRDQRQLTETEIAAVERGGIHVQGYHPSIVNDDEEELSSVDSQKVHFADHKIFKKTEQESNVISNSENYLINPVTGEIHAVKRISETQ